MTQKQKNSNVVFFKEDSPQAVESLKSALAKAGDLPLLGLVLKIERDPKGEERIVNWMFADSGFVMSLALVLPEQKDK
jgi:hypothetical protein